MTVLLVQGGRQAQAPLAGDPFHHWLSPAGTVWAEFFRMPGRYLVRSRDVADFVLSADGTRCEAWPVPGVPDETVEHVYRNMIVPLALSQQCAWVLHAAAVEVEGGCVLFAGQAGRGKSTLATYFAVNGHRFLSDDAVQVRIDAGHPLIVPGHACIRLWSDSHRALIAREPAGAKTSLNDKARFVAGDVLRHCDEALPLKRVYFLDEDDGEFAIERLPGAEALIALIRSTFLLDVDAAPILKAHFETMSALAKIPVFYSLRYPRDFAHLPKVRKAILEGLAAQ